MKKGITIIVLIWIIACFNIYAPGQGGPVVNVTGGGIGSSANTQFLFNNNGAVAGLSNFTTDGTNFTMAGASTFNNTVTVNVNSALNDSTNLWAASGNGGGATLGFALGNTAFLKWSSTSSYAGSKDLGLFRNAANVLEINNGTSGTFADLKHRYTNWSETTIPTAAANVQQAYGDSTSHELTWTGNNRGDAGSMFRHTRPGAITQTAKTASITTATLCAALDCAETGMYAIDFAFEQDGTACGTPGTGGVTLQITWTDQNATTHSAITVPLDDSGGGTPVLGTKFTAQTTNAAAWATGHFNLQSNGSIIQYATTYTACSVGTLTYALRISVVKEMK